MDIPLSLLLAREGRYPCRAEFKVEVKKVMRRIGRHIRHE